MRGSSDDRFREMFYEEARELLISLEEGLMDLERRQGDRAHLDKTFRAAHSFKGAAAMVGLAAIAEFTHGIEAVLDRIRGGLLTVDSDIITTLLEARDHLSAMVEAEAARSPIPPSGELILRLTVLFRGPAVRTGAGGEPPLSPASSSVPPKSGVNSPDEPLPSDSTLAPHPDQGPRLAKPESKAKRKRAPRKTQKMEGALDLPATKSPPVGRKTPGNPRKTVYRVTLTPGPDVLRRGVNPLGVLDELRELGETSITTDPALVPPLDQLDPERCYLAGRSSLRPMHPGSAARGVSLLRRGQRGDDRAANLRRRACAG